MYPAFRVVYVASEGYADTCGDVHHGVCVLAVSLIVVSRSVIFTRPVAIHRAITRGDTRTRQG